MLASTFARTLRSERLVLLAWGGGIVLTVGVLVAFYPTIQAQSAEFEALLKTYPPEMLAFFGDIDEFTTPAGYLAAELFGFMLPLFFVVYAIGRGAALAGEEESGVLEMLVSLPVARPRIVLEKAAALVVGTLILGAVAFASLLAGAFAVGMEIGPDRLFAGSLLVALLGLLFGALALAAGAAMGRRGASIGIAAGAAFATFFLNGFGKLVAGLDRFRPLSPFYWYAEEEPLKEGIPALGVLILVLGSVALIAAAALAFDRRDLRD